jgi:hypothetical protein
MPRGKFTGPLARRIPKNKSLDAADQLRAERRPLLYRHFDISETGPDRDAKLINKLAEAANIPGFQRSRRERATLPSRIDRRLLRKGIRVSRQLPHCLGQGSNALSCGDPRRIAATTNQIGFGD